MNHRFVSILTQTYWLGVEGCAPSLVSILAQPLGWVQ